jgi:hypothetical protein
MGCPGDDRPGLSQSRLVRERASVSSTRPLPTVARNESLSGDHVARRSYPRAGHRSRAGAPPRIDEGVLDPNLDESCIRMRGEGIEAKAARGSAIRSRSEIDRVRGQRVREVRPDHVLCCIVRASPSNRRSIKGGGVSGRGSCAAFTRRVVKRSRLSRERALLLTKRARGIERATGTSEVARPSALDGNKTPARGRADPPKRATAS